MAKTARYSKPNINNIKGKLGRDIYNHIVNTAPTDWNKVNDESNKVEKALRKAWGSDKN